MVLEQHPLINHAMVVGEGKPYVAALLVLNAKAWQQQATRLGLDPMDLAVLQGEAARGAVLKIVVGLLHGFPASSQIHGVLLITEDWTIDNGLITPTMKLIRDRIASRYAREIETMYQQHRGAANPKP
jgi:long-chain acyl-CoA synthetase